jgi:hypothetical protein
MNHYQHNSLSSAGSPPDRVEPTLTSTKLLKINACEYGVPEKTLIEFLSFFVEIGSAIVE